MSVGGPMSCFSRRSSRSSSQLLMLLLLCGLMFVMTENTDAADNTTTEEHEEEEVEPAAAVLFPWFSLIIGTFTYFFLSRFLHWMPYTAVMFIIGTVIGVAIVLLDRTTLLTESVSYFWLNIDSEVLLLVFLPGLVAKDAMQLDATLFRAAFWQNIVFAFPMVLAGTALTALVCFYIFPYGWSFNLAMTVGSILSATDPVAVAALMGEVGAPPRLQAHISGESLLNDGSAIVFFTIFSELYLLELGVPGLGTDIDVAQGFAMFFRMSLGAVASGLFFGLGTNGLTYLHNRRLNREENIVEVATIFTMAYLCYFVTDVVWGCSGVIGTLTYGLVINLASSRINDPKLQADFWALVEHLLNTVLFTLGGLVWGEIISNVNPDKQFTAQDWGYLFVLYAFLIVIRFFLLFVFYPITVNIGLKTNWQETVFSAFAGLRGAVGIALAIALNNVVDKTGIAEDELDVSRVFGFVGGIAFLTLVINATSAGPFLRKLGLADKAVIRQKVIKVVRWRIRQHLIDDMVHLLAEPRFHRVNFAVARHHIPFIQDLSTEELGKSVRRFQRPKRKFLASSSVPNLRSITPYLNKDKESESDGGAKIDQPLFSISENAPEDEDHRRQPRKTGSEKEPSERDRLDVIECRRLFLEILRASYTFQVENGELLSQEFLATALNQSLDFAAADVDKGLPLDDWSHTTRVFSFEKINSRIWLTGCVAQYCSCGTMGAHLRQDAEYTAMRYDVDRCLAFLEAHRHSREVFKNEFVGHVDKLTEEEEMVLQESQAGSAEATKLLDSYRLRDVGVIVSHRFCVILLNASVRYIEHLAETGLLATKEAEDLLGEIQELQLDITSCKADDHPGELPMEGDGETVPDERPTERLLESSTSDDEAVAGGVRASLIH